MQSVRISSEYLLPLLGGNRGWRLVGVVGVVGGGFGSGGHWGLDSRLLMEVIQVWSKRSVFVVFGIGGRRMRLDGEVGFLVVIGWGAWLRLRDCTRHSSEISPNDQQEVMRLDTTADR